MHLARALPLCALAGLLPWQATSSSSGAQATPAELAAGVEQLRQAVGEWTVTTEFLNPDGSVARAAEGTYRFDWVIEDRVLTGESRIPALGLASALLFYVTPAKSVIEMISIGADGEPWIMTGPIDGEVRTTRPRTAPDGSTFQLRFTRSIVEPDYFESRMERTGDGGRTWVPGNRQVFERAD